MRGAVVGRDPELDATTRFLMEVERGPAVLLFEGEPGIGKSTVWASGVDEARRQSFTVLTCRPVESEVPLAFAALSDLLEPVIDAQIDSLPEPQRRALAIALLREDPGNEPLDQRAICAATLRIVRGLATETPVVIGVDDVQWLDRSSRRVLEFVMRRRETARIGLLACQRHDKSRQDSTYELVDGQATRHWVGPLSATALQRVLEGRLGAAFPRRTARRIHESSGGNPFFALELARVLPAGVRLGETVPIPDNVRQLIERRLNGLPQRTRRGLSVIAALADPTADLAASTGAAPRGLSVAHLGPAADGGIVDIGAHEIRFAHPLFAAVVYAITPIHERRRIHRELASLVGGVEEQARHLALGADAPDEAVAQALDRAADNARRRGAPDAAAELAEHARRLTPAGNASALARRTTLVAQYLFHAGEFAQAEAMLAGVLGEATVGPTRADALRLLADVRAYQRGVAESIELEQEALGHVGDDPGRRAEIELSLSYLVEQLGDFAGAVEHARLASEFARRARDPAILASAIAVAEIAGFPIGLGCDSARIDEALRLEDVNQELRIELRPTLIAALLATYTGELRRSTELLAGLRARVLERGQESDLPLVSEYLAWAECWRGNLSVAEQMAAEAVATSVRLQAPFLECLAQSFAALVAAYAGDDDLTVGRVARTRQLIAETGVQIAGLWGDWSMAVLALSKDDPEAAVDALAPIIDVVLDRGLPEPVQVPSMPDAIEALGGLGELDRARRLLEILEESATRVNRTWALAAASRCRALLVAAHGDIDAASAHASEAVERGERLELRLDLARSLLVAGQIERRRRRKREAERRLARALEIFEEAGARLWAARTRREIDRIGRRPSKHELTETERRVAELAAAGHTNRQVASALFISPKTVEANLSRAYSKLGIHSRAELGARLGTVSRLLDVR